MTHETNSNPHGFSDSYPLPANPLEEEQNLLAAYTAVYPEQSKLLGEAFGLVHRAAGVGASPYRIDESQRGEAYRAGIADEQGNMTIGNGPNIIADMVLSLPRQPKGDEPLQAADGVTIVGELPNYTHEMLESVYRLVGAEVIRDDLKAGYSQGYVVRRGKYFGTPIYLRETYNQSNPNYNDQSSFRIACSGGSFAEEALAELNESQRQEFMNESGVTDYIGAVVAHHITPDNYKDVAAALKQTREVVDR